MYVLGFLCLMLSIYIVCMLLNKIMILYILQAVKRWHSISKGENDILSLDFDNIAIKQSAHDNMGLALPAASAAFAVARP